MPKEKETLFDIAAQKREAEELAKSLAELDLNAEDVEQQLAEIQAKLIKKINSLDSVSR